VFSIDMILLLLLQYYFSLLYIIQPRDKIKGDLNMSSLLKNIAQMQIMLADMEAEIGIRDIGTIEKSVLITIVDLANDADLVHTKDILQHPLNNVYSRPSLFRALKNLESLGKISKGGDKRGLYTLAGESA